MEPVDVLLFSWEVESANTSCEDILLSLLLFVNRPAPAAAAPATSVCDEPSRNRRPSAATETVMLSLRLSSPIAVRFSEFPSLPVLDIGPAAESLITKKSTFFLQHGQFGRY